MSKYAVVNTDNTIREFRNYATAPDANTTNTLKPRLLPVVLQDVVFNPVTEVKEGPVYTVEAARVLEAYTKRAKNAAEIQAMRDSKSTAIRMLADGKLSALVTMQKQTQALSVLVRLLYAHTDTTSWPAAQQTAVNAMLARLTDIQNIRQTEDTKVSEVQALATPTQIAAYDIQAGW